MPWPFWIASLPELTDLLRIASLHPSEAGGLGPALADAKVLGLMLMEEHWRTDARAALWWDFFVARRLPGPLLRLLVASRWGVALQHVSTELRVEPLMTWRYAKLSCLVEHVESAMSTRDVASLHKAIEDFARCSSNQWLKVAGGEKGEVLESAVDCSSSAAAATAFASTALEFGAFIGYTGARIANAGRSVLSFEHDPVHVRVAQHLLDLAAVPGRVEVWPGRVADLIPRVAEARGAFSTALAFLDESGASFHVDHARLIRVGLLGPGAHSAADNCLRPGAPVFLWRYGPGVEANWGIAHPQILNWSLPEFLEEAAGVEDWLSVVASPP